MFKTWDSDRKLLALLLAAAAVSLAVSYKDVLADTAGRLAQTVEGTLGELKSTLPSESPKSSPASGRPASFDPRGGRFCQPRCAQSGGSAWYGIVDCEGQVRVVGPCRTIYGCSH